MKTLNYIAEKFDLNIYGKQPVDIRDFDRRGLAELFRELGFKKGVEIGVRDGTYSEILMAANPDLELWGIDPYTPHKGYNDITRESTFDKVERAAHERLDKYSSYHFIKDYSAKAVQQFADESLDFVYIDGDHSFYEVAQDIHKWLPKIRIGGIISGDDYFKHKGPSHIHVYEVLNGYTSAWGITPWFVVGAKDIVPGEKRDHGRSWFWVK